MSIIEKIGRKKVVLGDIQNLHIEFLETMCKLWPITYKRYHVIKQKRFDKLPELNEKEKPILEKCENLLKIIWLLRHKLEESITNAGENAIDDIKRRCAEDFTFFINYFCYIYEPRLLELGLISKIPFILYPAQDRILHRIDEQYRNRLGILIEKSREAGISWGFCALVVHKWLFMEGFSCILGSEKEEKVDIGRAKNTLFGKLRFLIYGLPPWLRPSGYDAEGNNFDNHRKIYNPDNGSEIIGEVGENIGRSGRASMVIIDESQDISNPEAVDQSLESVVNCRVDVGTPRGMNHFAQRRFSGNTIVETIHWYEDPRKNPKWRDGTFNKNCYWRKFKEETLDQVTLAQEYDLDYQASVEGLFIKKEWINAAVNFELEEKGDVVAGFDVAGGGKNESVYIKRTGPVASFPQVIPFKTSTEALWAVIDKGEEDKIKLLNYDQDGIGESVFGQIATSDREIYFKINGIKSGSSASDKLIEGEGKFGNEKFRNKRAEIWWDLRTRFKKTYEHVNEIKFYSANELISIPNDLELINQIASPKIKYSNVGKIGVESKDEMKRRGIKSPDRADALVYAFSDYDTSGYVVDSFDYTSNKHFKNLNINFERCFGSNYVSLIQDEDMKLSAVLCVWSAEKLMVYDEVVIENATPDEVIPEIKDRANDYVFSIKEWVANEELIINTEKGKINTWSRYKKMGVNLKPNYFFDHRGSIILLNQMFDRGMIEIDKKCVGLFDQVREWRKTKGRPDKRYALSSALCQLVSRLKKKKLIPRDVFEESDYGRPYVIQKNKLNASYLQEA